MLSDGYRANVFAEGLDHPRFMAVALDGTQIVPSGRAFTGGLIVRDVFGRSTPAGRHLRHVVGQEVEQAHAHVGSEQRVAREGALQVDAQRWLDP